MTELNRSEKELKKINRGLFIMLNKRFKSNGSFLSKEDIDLIINFYELNGTEDANDIYAITNKINISNITLEKSNVHNPEFEKLLDLYKNKKNILITGQAGTGKTFLLNKLIDYLEDEEANYELAASTGTAAIHINGTTIHRLFGIKLANSIHEYDESIKNNDLKISYVKSKISYLSTIDVIIIDEISMVSDSLLNLIDHICKKSGNRNLPFGGKQIILSGDFLQLKPVKGKYSFESDSWKQGEFWRVDLTKIHRQENIEFTNFLSNIRIGKFSERDEDFIRNIKRNEVSDSATKLYSRNKDVEKENKKMLSLIDDKEYQFSSIINSNSQSLIASIKKSPPAPVDLNLKKGAKVISLINEEDLFYVNGSIGIVTEIEHDRVYVEFDNGYECWINKHTWEWKEKGEVIAKYRQIPLKLAWALTVHKSQGQTIDGELLLDCEGIFSDGQLYVGLSRIKDPEKLKILNFDKKNVMANRGALDFYSNNIEPETYIRDTEVNSSNSADDDMLAYLSIYENILQEEEDLERRKYEIREKISTSMSIGDVFENDAWNVNYKPAMKIESINKKIIIEKYPEIYNYVKKISERKPTLYITKKK